MPLRLSVDLNYEARSMLIVAGKTGKRLKQASSKYVSSMINSANAGCMNE